MLDTRDLNLRHQMIKRYEWLFNRPYLHELSCLPIADLSSCKASICIIEITFLPNSPNYTQFSYIFNALASFEQTIGCIIVSKNGSLSLYIGLKGNYPSTCDILKSGLNQIFPGSTFKQLDNVNGFLKNLFSPNKYNYLTSAVALPNVNYTEPLLPSFINLLGTKDDFIAVFLAQSINRNEILCCLNEFYEIHNILAQFTQTNYINYKSSSKSSSNSTATGRTDTCNESTTNTCNESHSKSKNCYNNLSFSVPFSFIAHRPSSVTEVVPRDEKADPNSDSNDEQSSTSNNSSSVIVTKTPSSITTTVEGPKNINTNLLLNRATGSSTSNGSSTSRADSNGNSNSTTNTRNHTLSETCYHSLSFSSPDKYIQNAVANLVEMIDRYTTLSKNNAYSFSSYFFSKCPDVSIRAAYSYLGLINNSSIFSPNLVSSWSPETSQFNSIFKFLRHFSHPSFCLTDEKGCVSNTLPLLSMELVQTLYLPIQNAIS